MVDLESLLQSAQDRDRVLDVRLLDEHRLESALERGVLLDVLSVLVERRRADAVQFAAREHRLQHVARVHRALGLARADDRVQFVDEEQDASLGALDLVEHGLQPLLELAAELRAGDERAHVEREHGLVLETFGHVAADDALRESLDDRGLADARFADEHGVVLRLAREDADRAADLLVAPDDGVELAGARECDEVASVLLERLVRRFGIRRGDTLAAAHVLQRLHHELARDAALGERAPGGGRPAFVAERQEQMLRRDVLVL